MRQTALRFIEDRVMDVRGYTVLLDIDGTLLPDGAEQMSDVVRGAVARLRQQNTIYLVSNGSNAARAARLARELEVTIAPVGVPAGKPFKRAARGIVSALPLVVIGDRLGTDGLFAWMLGVPFLRVRSKRSGAELFMVRLFYLLDDVVSLFV
jgi:predicted HAD superfamily phosphohydrolase YqeG